MEKAKAEEARRSRRGAGRRAEKQKEVVTGRAGPRPMLPPPVREVNLAAIAVDLNVRLRSADMPAVMQERAFRCTRALLDSNREEKKPNPTHLAMALKKEFDVLYGPAWHCIVGKSFGSFVTHSRGGFMYYSVEKLSFLLFKTQVRTIKK
ncbi:Dynein light chain [Trema orientale]|uniref:Dynein light chain n=1 Tax=Trema orientale TaxID=63057 RepID=A0A2P5EQP1_TREOI|nr:Dynein light chain [Trema orientale]